MKCENGRAKIRLSFHVKKLDATAKIFGRTSSFLVFNRQFKCLTDYRQRILPMKVRYLKLVLPVKPAKHLAL